VRTPGAEPRTTAYREGALAWVAPCALAAAALLIPACKSNLESVNDRLRAENLDLRKQVDVLNATQRELTAKLAQANRARQAALDPAVLEAIPRVAGVDIDSLSGFLPGDVSKPVKSVGVYLIPRDGRQRFVPAVGTLSVEVRHMPALSAGQTGHPEQEFTLHADLTPSQLRDAYRSGITGTHYAVELPLDHPLPVRDGTLLLRVTFADAITGQTYSAERIVKPVGRDSGEAPNTR